MFHVEHFSTLQAAGLFHRLAAHVIRLLDLEAREPPVPQETTVENSNSFARLRDFFHICFFVCTGAD
jgi:hypothetical protein